MTRHYINQLAPQQTINEVFVANAKQLRPNRNGNLYLQVELSDRTGSISARMWNASEAIYKSFDNGDYIRAEGSTQIFQGAVQMIVTRLHKIDPAEVDPAEFTPQPAKESEKLVARLSEMLRDMKDPHLRDLAECFLMDES
ncbi:MAG: OB-fold nucleic acid binding domain-containing protein, partial [Thermoguttaceae bacterium]